MVRSGSSDLKIVPGLCQRMGFQARDVHSDLPKEQWEGGGYGKVNEKVD